MCINSHKVNKSGVKVPDLSHSSVQMKLLPWSELDQNQNSVGLNVSSEENADKHNHYSLGRTNQAEQNVLTGLLKIYLDQDRELMLNCRIYF